MRWALDEGEPGRHDSSMAKAHVPEAMCRIIDGAVQICGSLSVSGDGPLGRLIGEAAVPHS